MARTTNENAERERGEQITQGEGQSITPTGQFTESTFAAVGQALQTAGQSPIGGIRRSTRWDQTPVPLQTQQSISQGSGAGIVNQPATNFSQDQFSQLINAISANNVYPNNDRYHDGKKVNVRGGIDRVITEQIPIDLQGRATWIKYAEVALSTNGSGIQMNSVDEDIFSCLTEQTWNQAQMRKFTQNRMFEYSKVFHPQGADQLVELTSVTGAKCKVKIPSRIWNALCAGLYGAIQMLLLKDSTLRFLHQDVAAGDAVTLLHNIQYRVNAVDKSAIDVLEHRLEELDCPTLDKYHEVRNDLAELIQNWEQALKDNQITDRDCKSTKVWKNEIARLFSSHIPGIRTYINSPDNRRKTIKHVLEECDARVVSRLQNLTHKRKNNEIDSNTSLYSSYNRSRTPSNPFT